MSVFSVPYFMTTAMMVDVQGTVEYKIFYSLFQFQNSTQSHVEVSILPPIVRLGSKVYCRTLVERSCSSCDVLVSSLKGASEDRDRQKRVRSIVDLFGAFDGLTHKAVRGEGSSWSRGRDPCPGLLFDLRRSAE
jgi:hypothetical protein